MAEPPVGSDATPQAVALATLDALREAQLSRAKGLGDPERKSIYETAMQHLRALAATKELHEQIRNSGIIGIPNNISEEAAVTHAIENWVSLVAHYVEGFQLSTLTINEIVRDTQIAVYLDAENPRDREILDSLRQSSSDKTTSTAPDDDEIRARAIDSGICPPLPAGIELRLKKVDGHWRVLGVGVGPARQPPATTAGDALPATVG